MVVFTRLQKKKSNERQQEAVAKDNQTFAAIINLLNIADDSEIVAWLIEVGVNSGALFCGLSRKEVATMTLFTRKELR